jgi:Delta3-Delta2-enoyl-CoA isomerase
LRQAPSLARFQSTSSNNLVLIDINDKNGIATLTMNRLPVNSLSLELLSALNDSLDILERENVKGMILASVRIFHFK